MHYKMSSAICFNLDRSKILWFCNVLNPFKHDFQSSRNIKFVISANGFGPVQLFSTQSQLLTTLRKKASEKIFGKGEKAGNQQFLFFSQNVFYPSKNKFHFLSHFNLSSASAFNLGWAIILSFGKELKL